MKDHLAIWEWIAYDFLKLNYTAKFNIGLEMNIYKAEDPFVNEEDLDFKILQAVYKSQKPAHFVELIMKAKYDEE